METWRFTKYGPLFYFKANIIQQSVLQGRRPEKGGLTDKNFKFAQVLRNGH